MENKRLEIIKTALEDKKASDIEILDVSEQTSLGDYFIVASCQSAIQVRACVDEIEEKMLDAGFPPRHKEGYQSGSWILIDYGDIIVHVMQQETREFYSIERLWNESGTARTEETEE